MLRQLFSFVVVTGLLTSAVQAEGIYGKVFDTMRGKIYPNARIVLGVDRKRETVTDSEGQYWFKDVKPGPYLVYIYLPEGEVVGRLMVYRVPTTIVNLDIARIDAPSHDDEY